MAPIRAKSKQTQGLIWYSKSMEEKRGWKKRGSSSNLVEKIEPDGKSFELWRKCAFISIQDYVNIFHDYRGFAGSPWFFQNSAWEKKKIKTLQSSDLGKDLFSLGEEKKKSSSFLGG